MGAAALMVFIAAFAATLEPLATVVLRSRALPSNTTFLARTPAYENPADTLADANALFAELGASAIGGEDAAIGLAIFSAFPGPKQIAIIQPNSLAITAWNGDREAALAGFKRIVAVELPSEREITLPDETRAVEIVADPELAKLTYAKTDTDERWTVDSESFTQALRVSGNEITFTTAPNPWGASPTYYMPRSCRVTKTGTRILTLGAGSTSWFKSMLNGIPAYLSGYSCFQAFSEPINR